MTTDGLLKTAKIMAAMGDRIRELETERDELKQEIAELEQQLVELKSTRPRTVMEE